MMKKVYITIIAILILAIMVVWAYPGFGDVSKGWVIAQIEAAFAGLSVNRATSPPVWTFSGYVKSETVNHAYGGFQDSAVVMDMAVGVWKPISNASKNLFTTVENDGVTIQNDTLTVLAAGDYSGTVTVTFAADAITNWKLRLYNVTQARQEGFWIGGSSNSNADYFPLTIPVHLITVAGDKITFDLMNESDNSDATLKSCVYLFTYTHEAH